MVRPQRRGDGDRIVACALGTSCEFIGAKDAGWLKCAVCFSKYKRQCSTHGCGECARSCCSTDFVNSACNDLLSGETRTGSRAGAGKTRTGSSAGVASRSRSRPPAGSGSRSRSRSRSPAGSGSRSRSRSPAGSGSRSPAGSGSRSRSPTGSGCRSHALSNEAMLEKFGCDFVDCMKMIHDKCAECSNSFCEDHIDSKSVCQCCAAPHIIGSSEKDVQDYITSISTNCDYFPHEWYEGMPPAACQLPSTVAAVVRVFCNPNQDKFVLLWKIEGAKFLVEKLDSEQLFKERGLWVKGSRSDDTHCENDDNDVQIVHDSLNLESSSHNIVPGVVPGDVPEAGTSAGAAGAQQQAATAAYSSNLSENRTTNENYLQAEKLAAENLNKLLQKSGEPSTVININGRKETVFTVSYADCNSMTKNTIRKHSLVYSYMMVDVGKAIHDGNSEYLYRYDTMGVVIRGQRQSDNSLTTRVFYSMTPLVNIASGERRYFLLRLLITLCPTAQDHWCVLDMHHLHDSATHIEMWTENKLKYAHRCDIESIVTDDTLQQYNQLYLAFLERKSLIYKSKDLRKRDTKNPTARVKNLRPGEVDTSIQKYQRFYTQHENAHAIHTKDLSDTLASRREIMEQKQQEQLQLKHQQQLEAAAENSKKETARLNRKLKEQEDRRAKQAASDAREKKAYEEQLKAKHQAEFQALLKAQEDKFKAALAEATRNSIMPMNINATATSLPGNSTSSHPGNSTSSPPGNSTSSPPGNSTSSPPGNATTSPPGNSITSPLANSTTSLPAIDSSESPLNIADIISRNEALQRQIQLERELREVQASPAVAEVKRDDNCQRRSLKRGRQSHDVESYDEFHDEGGDDEGTEGGGFTHNEVLYMLNAERNTAELEFMRRRKNDDLTLGFMKSKGSKKRR